jgi:hypothetical protein
MGIARELWEQERERSNTGKDVTPLGQHLVNNPPKISPGFFLIHTIYLQDEKEVTAQLQSSCEAGE